MYKVLIADDEKYVIESLIRGVKWKEYGFEVVASAIDGVEALEAIERIKPQLVFTDIRMPGMNGLELIKNSKKKDREVLFVVISGYAEFTYAQKAIKHGAIGFCVKPFEDEEINSILNKAKNILDERNSSNVEIDILSLIEDFTDKGNMELESFFEKNIIGIEKGITIAVSIGSKLAIINNDIKYVSIKIDRVKYLYFIENENNRGYKQILSEEQPEEIRGIGVCDVIKSTLNLRKYVDDAITLAYQFFITGRKGIYCKTNIDYKPVESVIKDFEKASIKADINEARKAINDLENNIENQTLNIKHAMNIYNAFAKFSSQALYEQNYVDCVYSLEELCSLFKDIRGMLEKISITISGFIGIKTGIFKEDLKNEGFIKIIDYINENFYKEITIQTLSQDFMINSNYISQLFKKEVGITFTDYITNLRIDYAKELLRETKFSLEEIANKCGYTDYFYFIRVFKKITGIAPGQFRRK